MESAALDTGVGHFQHRLAGTHFQGEKAIRFGNAAPGVVAHLGSTQRLAGGILYLTHYGQGLHDLDLAIGHASFVQVVTGH